ncbi:cytochrome C [Pseudodesulfovibrio cashew]|uniref:Cytochrome c-type protein n=1 Tax=Pseudodesulfovibrio cashew TaxID=2678688 RepID=A0A6I6JIA5_9BACT|nr:NapC/NirT family cytochrome c [Pseudodesulfovibrio cashew]QGY40032.1 cytochrome C [Pseudodesulfovibrio cashew]
MRKWFKPTIWICVGIVLGFPIFSMAYYTMVRTSTPEFCASCHEIQPAYQAWRTSTHVNNPQGFVADCMDCHLPAPHDTVNFFYTKTLHGAKDVLAHFMGEEYDRKAMRTRATESIKNAQCLKCHRNIEYMPHKRGAMLAHRQVLYPMPGYEKRCLDCHSNLVHTDRGHYDYKGMDS